MEVRAGKSLDLRVGGGLETIRIQKASQREELIGTGKV